MLFFLVIVRSSGSPKAHKDRWTGIEAVMVLTEQSHVGNTLTAMLWMLNT